MEMAHPVIRLIAYLEGLNSWLKYVEINACKEASWTRKPDNAGSEGKDILGNKAVVFNAAPLGSLLLHQTQK